MRKILPGSLASYGGGYKLHWESLLVIQILSVRQGNGRSVGYQISEWVSASSPPTFADLEKAVWWNTHRPFTTTFTFLSWLYISSYFLPDVIHLWISISLLKYSTICYTLIPIVRYNLFCGNSLSSNQIENPVNYLYVSYLDNDLSVLWFIYECGILTSPICIV